MFPERIETDRLELLALTPANVDVLDYYDICSGNADGNIEAVTEYLPWEPHDTPKETKEFLDQVAEQREAGEDAQFAVRVAPSARRAGGGGAADHPADDRIAGAVGLTPHWERRTGELSIWLREPFWGRGYYGEAFAALARVAFDRLDLELVEILHRRGNEKSRRATEKFVAEWGGRHEARLRNFWTAPDGVADAHRYTVSKAEYESAEREEDEQGAAGA